MDDEIQAERPEAEVPASVTSEPETAEALVGRMLGQDWPEVPLLEAIRERGREALEPLRAAVRNRSNDDEVGWGIILATQLLGELREPETLPELVALYRTEGIDVREWLGGAIAGFGRAAVEPLLEILHEPELDSTRRNSVAEIAVALAGDDLTLRSRIAEALRPSLAALVGRARAGEELTDDEYEDATLSVCNLSDLADPASLEVIREAFALDIVDGFFIGETDVETSYNEGGTVGQAPDPDEWFDIYRERLADERRMKSTPLPSYPTIVSPPLEPAAWPPPRQEPIHNNRTRPGRNDPCWCGSGKKYKKCHMADDDGTTTG